jgi:hypothetical protein
MKFKTLQDGLREVIRKRIEAGEVTGLELAKAAGFKQAHISNFLNRKRGLSIEAMDRVLGVQRLSVLDLLDPKEVSRRASISSRGNDEFQDVPLVDQAAAANASFIMRMKTKEIVKFRKDFLRKFRASSEGPRNTWERFVAVKLQARDAPSMYPRLRPGSTLLIDRHYNSLRPYRRGEFNMYAVLHDGHCTVRYVELAANQLVLRPHNQQFATEIMPLQRNKHAFDHIVGRVCHVGFET